MKLHLGSGKKLIHGFVNVDIDPSVGADVIDDVFALAKFDCNSADYIYCSHCLEHSSRETSAKALMRWFDVLKPGGMLRVAVPDIAAAFEWYRMTGKLEDVKGLIWGGQKTQYDFHYTGWDERTLALCLESVGFKGVQRYDWRTTEHYWVDDYSSAALPCVSYKTRHPSGKLEGVPVSLNMQGSKP